MNFTLLKYFSVVAETRHMTKSAKLLNISQPSLTSGIKRLENEVGVELFDRSTRNIVLNEYGQIFYEHVQNIDREYMTAMRRINELKNTKEKQYNLSIPSWPAKHDLAEILLSKGFSLKFCNMPENWQHALVEGKIDLVATLEEYTSPNVDRLILCHDQLVIVANPHHPLASMPSVTVDDINTYPFSSTSTDYSPLACAKNKIARLGLKPNITFYANGIHNVIDSVLSSDRLAFMVKRHLPLSSNLAVLNVENFDILLPLYLYWRADKPRNSIDFIIECIKNYYREMNN